METPISVFLITLNEGKHIRRVLNSVSWADEVIVMDSGSTDATVEICKQMAVQVLHQDWLGYSAQKAAALAHCRNEWCLNIDGDEIVSESLKLELQKRVALDDVAGIEIPINDIIMGRSLSRFSRKRRITRLFRRSRASYPDDRTVHENLQICGKVVRANECLIHFGYDDPITFFAKQAKYAQLRAEDKYRAGRRGSVAKLWLIAPFTFFKTFVLGRLIFSGTAGLVVARAEAIYAFCKEAHLIELGRAETEANPGKTFD